MNTVQVYSCILVDITHSLCFHLTVGPVSDLCDELKLIGHGTVKPIAQKGLIINFEDGGGHKLNKKSILCNFLSKFHLW